MNDTTDTFHGLRPRLQGIAYHMRERAALNWAETMTRLVENHGSRNADFEELQVQFSDLEIVELTWTIARINTWNRMAVGMQMPVPEKSID
ncbi:MAG: hypothetical protein V4858_20245 [Pseudomonadota bacterium]